MEILTYNTIHNKIVWFNKYTKEFSDTSPLSETENNNIIQIICEEYVSEDEFWKFVGINIGKYHDSDENDTLLIVKSMYDNKKCFGIKSLKLNYSLRKTYSQLNYFASDINLILNKQTPWDYGIMNMDLNMYKNNYNKTGKIIARYIESKHYNEKFGKYEMIQLDLLNDLCENFNDKDKFAELGVFIMYTNAIEWYPDKLYKFRAEIKRLSDGISYKFFPGKEEYNKFLRFCSGQCTFDDLLKKDNI